MRFSADLDFDGPYSAFNFTSQLASARVVLLFLAWRGDALCVVVGRSVGMAGPVVETSQRGEDSCCALCRCGRAVGGDLLSVGTWDRACFDVVSVERRCVRILFFPFPRPFHFRLSLHDVYLFVSYAHERTHTRAHILRGASCLAWNHSRFFCRVGNQKLDARDCCRRKM